jgi:hypothetical protein
VFKEHRGTIRTGYKNAPVAIIIYVGGGVERSESSGSEITRASSYSVSSDSCDHADFIHIADSIQRVVYDIKPARAV